MSGTKAGGLKAAETNKKRHGEDFYKNMGRIGGQISRHGGFAANPQLAREAGRKGGASRSEAKIAATQRNMQKLRQSWWKDAVWKED